ncbi:hypothetical protein L1887_07024 [Cichorium endivia]|nr:hypothetical protein L1887_07024 [Cichorium endivia]
MINHNISMKREAAISPLRESPKDSVPDKCENLKSDPPNEDPINLSPTSSPIQEEAKSPIGPLKEEHFNSAQSNLEKGEIGENSLKGKELSGKLKILLSRNITIAEKLADEGSILKRMDGEDRAKVKVDTKLTQSIVEPRLTRSQSQLIMENSKRRTRASSRSTQSENLFISTEVAQRLEEVGCMCGIRKGKEGKIGAFSGK